MGIFGIFGLTRFRTCWRIIFCLQPSRFTNSWLSFLDACGIFGLTRFCTCGRTRVARVRKGRRPQRNCKCAARSAISKLQMECKFCKFEMQEVAAPKF